MKQCRWLFLFIIALSTFQAKALDSFPLSPPDTHSPRATYESFTTIVAQANSALSHALADETGVTTEEKQRVYGLFNKATQTFDLSDIPASYHQRIGIESVMLLKEVLDRLPPFDVDAIPDDHNLTSWRIPNSSIEIVRSETGQFLFSKVTVDRLFDYYSLVKHLPANDATALDYYEYYSLSAGRLIPPAWFHHIEGLPKVFMSEFGDQALWQWLAITVLTILLAGYAFLVYRRLRRAIVKPVLMAAGLFTYIWLADDQLNLTGSVMSLLNITGELLLWPLVAQVAYMLGASICQWLIGRDKSHNGLRRSLAQISGTIIGSLCAVAVLGFGLHRLGVPVYGIVTGLSLGGMAIALAIRPTMENLIGGVILFMDRSLSVGDFCAVGKVSGVVEQIGVRSTRIRAKDRTQITMANGDLAKMEIINFSRRDRYPFLVTLGLRYETPMEDMVQITRGIKECLAGNDSVLSTPLRVHFSAFSDYSMDIEVFAHIDTSDRETFLNIQQKLLMDINTVILEHGAKFALPSNTTYLHPDNLAHAMTPFKRINDSVT
ncbi:mechanosensitive ion channel protein MscS [Vibrio sp. 10N.286.49.C2]|uniref:mechanosensitive ion channel family protein n=1 Tax=unclassified Vibrio TaxID=2614977 RepID=UPI000C84FE17|nr:MULTISPECIES: mechanosensitive ion channel domain-containing protein [unclassified Vibrio]PMH30315.1 mechanosensitive ion channel protein MscS [Vibrio sp. 10N.286.49.C2]PMH50864.1 mechanosensitive ion channel protein MscS [Vibrio sp. 10N.286.49.B1]PMH80565.1 mechanosensitive ion channel protein MscS [Vibrio sp. 10N.286.48.B7]